MGKVDPLRIVEAGYAWAADEREWLAGIAEAAAAFGIGTGVAAFCVELARKPCIESFVGHATPPSFETEVRAFTSAFDRTTAREMYAPAELVGNASYRLRRLAKARKKTVEQLTKGHTVASWALLGGDPRKRAITLAFPAQTKQLDPDRPFPHARVLGLAAAHLGAALRLRALAAPDADAADSVLTPSGKLLHAVGPAQKQRESLVEAVVRRERARGRLRQVAADEATSLWSVLVSGQWSIVDFVDRDGKRLLLARKNPVAGPDIMALTEQERDVVWLATQGHSCKYIAYELGLSTAQVTRRLTSAQRKLRLDSRRELLRRFSGVK